MIGKPDIAVKIGAIEMKNPVMVASGTFGYGPEYAGLIDLNRLGAIVVKGISLEPHEGNPTPRIVEVASGIVNAIGLQNPGVAGFVDTYMKFLRGFDTPVIVNIWGRTVEEYAEVAKRLSDVEGVAGLEVNISCPNIKEGGIAFGTDPKMTEEVITAVRKATDLTIIPKLSAAVTDIGQFAKIAENCGSDAISLINSLPSLVIDVGKRKPALANTIGGLTGPAIRPVAVKLVWQAASAVEIPVIGMGGITSGGSALEFIIAGASAVAVGTATFTDPSTVLSVIDGIEAYLIENGLGSIGEIVGSLDLPAAGTPNF